MAKNKISEYSATAANNTDVANINIAEGCSPSNVNNAIRGVMAHLKDFQNGNVTGNALAVAGGGTGAESASGARTNLGLGALSVLDTVDTAQIDNDAITTVKILDANVTTAKIADSNVTTDKINDDAVTSAKIAENAVDATALNVSGNGTSGQVLLSDGDGSMTWGTAVGLGINQSYSNVTGSRSYSTTYTNSTGSPIFVSVLGSGNATMKAYVDGAEVQRSVFTTINTNTNVGFIVPNSSTYSVTCTAGTPTLWTELR